MEMAGENGKGRLPHLSGAGAAVRQAIAAHFLTSCRTIVEIGGAGLPITGFLTHRPDAVTVFDPKIEPFRSVVLNGCPCRVEHRAEKFQAASLQTYAASGSLGVALLGLSLKPLGARESVSDDLLALLCAAETVVIEHSRTLARALDQAPLLLARSGLATAVSMDLSISDGVLEAAGHGERRLVVLRRQR